MAENSKIEWTDHTFNAWRGCTEDSPACDHCYAREMAKRNPSALGIWGQDEGATRVVANESYWSAPIKWNRDAERAGVRKRVFCLSLGDVFEGDDTIPMDQRGGVWASRLRLLRMLPDTPWLDWQFLTKRPQNVCHVLATLERETNVALDWLHGDPPANVWLGATAENQEWADKRIPHLLETPAAVRFLSCEPMLGRIELSDLSGWETATAVKWLGRPILGAAGINWVIVGGESGPHARPMHPDWARSIRDQCVAAGVAFHFKQWGEWSPTDYPLLGASPPQVCIGPNGREQWMPSTPGMATLERAGKKAAGRLLDGRTWDELPAVTA